MVAANMFEWHLPVGWLGAKIKQATPYSQLPLQEAQVAPGVVDVLGDTAEI